MKESQYIHDYLDTTRTRPITVGTYLTYTLRGRAKRFGDVYRRALQRAIDRRVKSGEVKAIPSVRGGTSYVAN